MAGNNDHVRVRTVRGSWVSLVFGEEAVAAAQQVVFSSCWERAGLSLACTSPF